MKSTIGQKVIVVVLFILVFFASNVLGQEKEYPTKAINLWLGYNPGGGAGTTGTPVAEGLKKYLKQPVVMNYKPGATQAICAEFVANSAPDGYTLFWLCYGDLIGKVAMDRDKIRFRIEDLDMTLGGGPYITLLLGVNAESPWKTVEDVIAAARQSPGKLTISNTGTGNTTHVLGMLFAKENGIVLNNVPFAGAAPSVTALLGGHIDMMIGTISTYGDHIKPGGKLRGLLVFDKNRVAGVPSSVEKGINLTLNTYFGLAAPKGLPKPVRATIVQALKDSLEDPEVNAQLSRIVGVRNEPLNPEQALKKVEEESRIYNDFWKTAERK